VLGKIQPHHFFFCGYSQADGGLDQVEEQPAHYRSPASYRHYAESLYPQLMKSTAVKESYGHAVHIPPYADREGSEDTVDHMHRDGTDRIIYEQYFIDKFDRQDH